MQPKKHLSFGNLRKTFSKRVLQIEDTRREGSVSHVTHDCCLSGFAMMFFQDPSMLAFQKRLQEHGNKNNLQTMFGVKSTPKSSQLRDVIDLIPSSSFDPIFSDYFSLLQRAKLLEKFRFFNKKYLVSIDGTQYFSSESISCPGCLEKTYKDGTTVYSHQFLGASIVHPEQRQVIPLAPEPIQNVDGTSKQDCERNAGKRLIQKIRQTHPKLNIIIAGDDLFANQPFIDTLKSHRMSFILVAKPGDHKFLFRHLSSIKQNKIKSLKFFDPKGRQHIYKWINDVPLNGTTQAGNVNFFEYTIMAGDKRNYHCSWVTDITVDQANVEILVKGGRARWKIENEYFNTLKNQGYHAEHNYGHGQQYASFNFLLFILLAFFAHQILELTDPLYQQCRSTFSSRKEYWNQLRCTIRIHVFNSFEHLLEFIITASKNPQPP